MPSATIVSPAVHRQSVGNSRSTSRQSKQEEQVAEMVEYDCPGTPRITMPPYGAEFKNFFSNSDSQVPKLAERIHFVPSAVVGQQEAIQNKQAHLENRRYQQLKIAQRFTKTDGTPKLYIGRDSILPGQAAWPIPHDAPYRPVLDRSLMAVIEAGLYEKWSKDLLFQVQMNTRRRQQQQQWAQQEEEEESQKTFRQLASRLSHHHTPAGSIFAPPFGLWPCRTCLYYGGLSHVAFTEKYDSLTGHNFAGRAG
ncbi:uncharacterized protein LOC121872772 [Homarus americanus]|uniref:uncharacterized protein LOC121872772 n=1 Tax=Homarus americanus TaxID=6706 RepID=UPI001C4798E2|nr:uncharacterized protein LOC121872772 [Homarus americanus]